MAGTQARQHRRLSLDLTPEQHTWLKTEAAHAGCSMRQLAIEKIGLPKSPPVVEEVDDAAFNKELKKSLKRNDTLLSNLAKR